MPIKIRIAERCRERGISTAYKLQKALNLSPTVANRLFKGDFDKIGIGTIDKLCRFLDCQPGDLFEFRHNIVSLDKYRNEFGTLPEFKHFKDELSNTDLLSLADAGDCIHHSLADVRYRCNRGDFHTVKISRQRYIFASEIKSRWAEAMKTRTFWGLSV